MAAVMPAGDQFNQEPGSPQPAFGQELAILDDCRAVRLGEITEFAECLVQTRPSCAHRLVFSRFHYCLHPRREEIIARTLSAGPAPQH